MKNIVELIKPDFQPKISEISRAIADYKDKDGLVKVEDRLLGWKQEREEAIERKRQLSAEKKRRFKGAKGYQNFDQFYEKRNFCLKIKYLFETYSFKKDMSRIFRFQYLICEIIIYIQNKDDLF